jgi:CBS domain-containing protein
MLVEHVLPSAKKRLVTITIEQPLRVAADLLCRSVADLVVVCDGKDRLAGVVTKTDIVRQMGHCCGGSCSESAAIAMSRDVTSCHPSSNLEDVFSIMKTRGISNVPIIDDALHPLGVLNARDALEILLTETEQEDALLRDYVTCTGYR